MVVCFAIFVEKSMLADLLIGTSGRSGVVGECIRVSWATKYGQDVSGALEDSSYGVVLGHLYILSLP